MTPATPLTGPAAAAAEAANAMSPEAFLNLAAASDQYEIQAGRIAEVQGAAPQVKAFAREMVEAHSRTRQSLEAAGRAAALPPPALVVNGDQQRMLSALQSLKGAEFDKAYLTQQVNAHVSALTTVQAYASAGTEPHLREAAKAAAPLVEHHLATARALKDAVGKGA